ncbi:MAG: response regulator, partial [Herminiimonas sp.]|nr:response regulator [Herminiimonas sp.]
MISHSSAAGVPDNFDTGPLSWVMGEIREALNRSAGVIEEAVAQDTETQATALRHAKMFLHQAHGALQMVDVEGVTIITETAEDILNRMASGTVPVSVQSAQQVANAYNAMIEYLEELLAGSPHQPVRLFPYYKELLQLRGAERIHPSELFFPNLAIRPQLPPAGPDAGAPDSSTLRQRYEKALLPFLKSTDRGTELANAAVMHGVIGEVERAQTSQQSRGFWWVMRGFAELMSSGKLSNEVHVKQLFARINMQIRRLGKEPSGVDEALLRDALFFIALADDPSPSVQQIRTVYQLDGMVPADFEKKRYGQIDAEALTAAKARLSQAKSMWNRVASGDASAATPFEQAMQGLSDSGTRLNSASLTKL